MSDLTVWENGAINVVLPVAFLTVFVIFLNLYDKYSKDSHLRIADKKHTWRPVNIDRQSFRCSVCEVLMVTIEGVYCDSCGFCVDTHCLRKVAGRFKCKEISIESDGPMRHRWIKGNLPDSCSCDVCSGECSDDMRCIWCHRTVHDRCLHFLGEVCDFGMLRQVVVPPNHVHIGRKKSRVQSGLQLHAISDPGIATWMPLFVIGNPASGSRVGEKILSGFRFFLNPLQVSELSPKTLDRLAYILSLMPVSSTPNILVAGGDGSVASVLTALYQNRQNIKCAFRVGIVPLGTGNDLSRILGWGKEEPQPFSPVDLLNKVVTATPIQLDRWEVKVGKIRHLGIERRPNVCYMYNYMSVGVDARVTLDFHRARSSALYLGGRLINKALYLAFGTQQVVDRKCTGLEKEIQVELDGLVVELPELEAVVLLNIPSWGAGCNLWQLKESDEEISEQSVSDGKIELAGIYSSFHMAQLQVGLSTPYRIGQASSIRIALKKKLPMQIDGEPWMQPPGVIEVNRGGQVTLLAADSHSDQ